MKSISLDFKNNMVCIMQAGQQGTEYHPTLQKADFLNYIPQKYQEYESFTWNFEDEMFSVNQDHSPVSGEVRVPESFIPKIIISMPGLKPQFDNFLSLMGYEKVNTNDLLNEIMLELLSAAFNEDNEEKDDE